MIDTHVHYNLAPLAQRCEAAWDDAHAAGVVQSVVIGTNLQTSQGAMRLAAQHPHFWASVGIHPCEWNNAETTKNMTADLHQLEEFVQHDTAHHIRAIGETGLDFFHWEDMSAEQITKVKQQQRDALVAHMRIAQTHHLPLILHVRDRNTTFEDVSPIRQHEQLSAYSEVISLLHAHWLNPNIPLVLHCFSGSATYARAAQKLGAYFSFAGNITYPTAQPLRDILHTLPPNHVLIETDAPFLPPQRHRGKSCEPAWIAETAECVCKITHMTPLQLVENARLVFEYAIRKSGTDA